MKFPALILAGLCALLPIRALAEEGANACIATQFSGPDYASILYRNTCSETITAKICSKFLVSELWNALNGRAGAWTCSGVRAIGAGATIDIRITATEESSLARKAMAETSYRAYTCRYPLKPVIRDKATGRYDCIKDPADSAPSWDASEFERMTQVRFMAQDQILGYAPAPVDCSPDISHEIAVVFPDAPLTARDVISEMRRVHMGISRNRTTAACYLSGSDGPLVRFQMHGFIGQRKIFVVNYAIRHFYEFPDYEGLHRKIEGTLAKSGYLIDECDPDFVHDLVAYHQGRGSKTITKHDVTSAIHQTFRRYARQPAMQRCVASAKEGQRVRLRFTYHSALPPGAGKVVAAFEFTATGFDNVARLDNSITRKVKESMAANGY